MSGAGSLIIQLRQGKARPGVGRFRFGNAGIEKRVKRGVMPRQALFLEEPLQPLDGSLHDLLPGLLVSGITEVDATAQRPNFSSGAPTIDLERATVRGYRGRKRRCRCQEMLRLDAAEEQDVAPFGEAAAATALVTARAGRLNLGIDVGIKLQQLFADSRIHKRMTDRRRVISSAEINSPVPAPGHTALVRAQAAGVLTLLSQKGQVRHCPGRTS